MQLLIKVQVLKIRKNLQLMINYPENLKLRLLKINLAKHMLIIFKKFTTK